MPWQSQSFSVLWNCVQLSITTISLFSLGVLSGNRRFQSIHSLLFWRLLHSNLLFYKHKLNVGLIYSLCQIFWNVNVKSYCILKVGLSQFIAAVGKTQAVWNTTLDLGFQDSEDWLYHRCLWLHLVFGELVIHWI